MKQKEPAKFMVINWDFNRDEIEHYDVLPYFRGCFKDRKKRSEIKNAPKLAEYYKVPETLEDFKTFIENESVYMYWGRCQYEVIVHGWPVRKNDYKLDVHEQVMMNLDVIAEILWKELGKSKGNQKVK